VEARAPVQGWARRVPPDRLASLVHLLCSRSAARSPLTLVTEAGDGDSTALVAEETSEVSAPGARERRRHAFLQFSVGVREPDVAMTEYALHDLDSLPLRDHLTAARLP
jgi:hypothetical protein